MTNEDEYLRTAMYAKLHGGGDDGLDKLIASEDYLNDDGFSDYEADDLDADLAFADDLAEDNFDDESYYFDEFSDELDDGFDDDDCDDYYDYWEDDE